MTPANPDEHSALYKTWVMLLNGYGYNWYRQDNQLRADDLLVREHASHFVLEAAKKLQEQEAAYARQFLPTPTRENPFPPDDKLATHALIRSTRQNLLALEGRIRGLSAPPTDRIWQRHRSEVDTLARLTSLDVQLVGLSKEIDTEASRLDLEAWSHPERLVTLADNTRKVEQVIADRAEVLLHTT
jgi:hypothetical protein